MSRTGVIIAAVVGIAVSLVLFMVPASAQHDKWLGAIGKDFPSVGGNIGNQRYSGLTRITPENVSQLGGAWMVHVNDQAAGGNMEATPVVVNGVMYIATGAGGVLALNATTGAKIW